MSEVDLHELGRRREAARAMGGPEAVAAHRAGGRMTARERIESFLDPGTFREFGALAGKGRYSKDGDLEKFTPSNCVTGAGEVGGRRLIVASDDFTLRGGSSEAAVSDKWVYAERMAYEFHMPLVRFVDSAGGSVKLLEQMGRTKIPGYVLWPVTPLLGVVPVAGIAFGSCAGLGAARVISSHFSVMIKGKSYVFAAGPPVVKQGLGQDVTKEELGGSTMHTRYSGVVNNAAETEADALEQVRRFLSYLPRHVWELPPRAATRDDPRRRDERLNGVIPEDRRKIFDPRTILASVLDEGSFFEIAPAFGGSVVAGLGRLDGYAVGVMISNPAVMGGALTRPAAQKMERFVDVCDTFHLPIVNLVDQPGTMTGPEAERAGTLISAMRAGAAIEQARVPWVSVVIRRAFGLAGSMLGPWYGTTGSSLNHRFAWPCARWGSIPIEGGVAAAYRREIEAAPDPQARRDELERYYHKLASPFRTAEAFGVVDIIEPAETRAVLCHWVADAFELTRTQTGIKTRTMR
jgi:acetyl-CoA carboxylase carboxyltransferase component